MDVDLSLFAINEAKIDISAIIKKLTGIVDKIIGALSKIKEKLKAAWDKTLGKFFKNKESVNAIDKAVSAYISDPSKLKVDGKFNLYAAETKNVDTFINLGNDVYDAFDKRISFVETAKEETPDPEPFENIICGISKKYLGVEADSTNRLELATMKKFKAGSGNAAEAVKSSGYEGFLTCKNVSDYWTKLSTWNKSMTDKCSALKTRLSKIGNDRVRIEFLKEAGAELNWIYNITTLAHTVPSVFVVTASNLMASIYNASTSDNDNIEFRDVMKGNVNDK